MKMFPDTAATRARPSVWKRKRTKLCRACGVRVPYKLDQSSGDVVIDAHQADGQLCAGAGTVVTDRGSVRSGRVRKVAR